MLQNRFDFLSDREYKSQVAINFIFRRELSQISPTVSYQ